MSDTPNPWPENSDYGKRWRKGYSAGRSDAAKVFVPALERALAKNTDSPPPMGEEQP